MFALPTERLGLILDTISVLQTLTENDVENALDEIRQILLEAHAGDTLVQQFVVDVRNALTRQRVFEHSQPGRQFAAIMRLELAKVSDTMNLPRETSIQEPGKGNIVSFSEKAQEASNKKQFGNFQKRARKTSWDLEDFLQQMQQIKKMGGLGDLMQKIPGVNKMMPKGMDVEEDEMKHMEAIIYSMTPRERHKPRIIDQSRRRRIAKGSGTTIHDVNRLLGDYCRIRPV